MLDKKMKTLLILNKPRAKYEIRIETEDNWFININYYQKGVVKKSLLVIIKDLNSYLDKFKKNNWIIKD